MPLSAVALTYLTAGSGLISGLGGSAGFGETTLARTDDGSSSGIDITPVFGVGGLNFFGTAFTRLWVNTNGNITFASPASSYNPSAITAGANNPIIAPFWGDVDTRGGAATPSSGGNSTGTNQVHYDLDTVNGVFTATWDDVGYFNRKTNKLNAFQIQLLDEGSGNFTIVLRYEGLNWTTGDFSGGSNGLGGNVARAGYSAGDGVNAFELPASGNQAAMLALSSTQGNTGQNGTWVFRVLSAAPGNSTVQGGTDEDIITGSTGDNEIRGLDGDDLLRGGDGDDTMGGGMGNDTLDGGMGDDRMHGRWGDDLFRVNSVNDVCIELPGQGDDTVEASSSYALLPNIEKLVLLSAAGASYGTGNAENNRITGNAFDNTLAGGMGDDTLLGGNGADRLSGENGNDLLDGGAGADTLGGGAGHDSLLGGAENDLLRGEAGLDTLEGGDGADTLMGGGDADLLLGGLGADSMAGDAGNDTLEGEGGNDTLAGGTEADTLRGGADADLLYGDAGMDVLEGGAGADTLAGGTEADSLLGGTEADWLYGGAGNDTLAGGAGNDVLFGEAGADLFIIGGNEDIDVIADFEPGIDRIQLLAPVHGSFAAMMAASGQAPSVDVGFISLIPLGNGHALRLRGVELSQLHASDFIGF